ncbi:secretory lipase family protein [Mycobacterium antarcticum]|uniref:lipase family protein n=1 Tax=Mycolicibacterium sp. TUM20983 TaxID=3023369 RepID=UPI002386A8CC|nr:lipase family protein [Mycolicibacterium sp. TUM20983]GLP77008.1 secretory lipase family protein [Mycolicibacterium sp. TUM20983]
MGRVVGVLLVLLLCGTLTTVPPSRAEPDPTNDVRDPKYNEDQYLAFYTPPEPLPPGRPGDLIRTEPSRLVLEPSGQLGAIMATGTRIMYRSNDARGNPIAVTGTYFEPFNDWPGHGPRPLIVYGPGTQGQGDQCAPSRQFNQGIHFSPYLDLTFNYEELFVATMVARGFAIVMTDYQGLGTPGLHTYVNRVAEGNAMLDAGRAAMRIPDTSLDPEGPLAFWGYSQGGGAAAAAAELAPSYAPEVKVVGTYAGAPPADLKELFPYADGSALVGVVGYALNSVITTYPEFGDAIRAAMTPRGVDLLQEVQDQCIAETVSKFMFRHLQPYFTEDLISLVEREPFRSLFDLQRIGTLKPAAPVLINSNRFDPLVPWTGANQLGHDWCAKGADVEFRTNEQPPFLNKLVINHALPMLVDGEAAMQWIADRFNGVPTTPNCGRF